MIWHGKEVLRTSILTWKPIFLFFPSSFLSILEKLSFSVGEDTVIDNTTTVIVLLSVKKYTRTILLEEIFLFKLHMLLKYYKERINDFKSYLSYTIFHNSYSNSHNSVLLFLANPNKTSSKNTFSLNV